MKAGKMTAVITIDRASHEINDAGSPVSTWANVATLRAEVIERSTEEFLRRSGDTDETTIVFRTHYFPSLRNTDRIGFDGEHFDIEELTTIGRRRGLELRCVVSGEST